MVLLGILTGMRIGEIRDLRRKDVKFHFRQIRIEQACYRGLLGSPRQRQQTYSSLANRTRETPHAHMRKGDTNKRRDLYFKLDMAHL